MLGENLLFRDLEALEEVDGLVDVDEELHVDVTFKSSFAAFILVFQECFKLHIRLALVSSSRVLA